MQGRETEGIDIYSLLVAQGEKELPTGLLQHIDWGKHGIELIGSSEKLSCVFSAVYKFKPDIVIIDMKTSPLTLLLLINQLFLGNTTNICELLKQAEDVEFTKKMLTKHHTRRISDYSPEIVILFDYKDYVYALQALAYGASACIMKPYTINELISTIQNAKDSISSKQRIPKIADKSNLFNSLIKKTMKYIQSNYSDNIGLSDISSKFYLSPNYLCTLFKKDTGISLNNYIQKIRVENARQLLLKTESGQIPEVARATGFNDEKYFYGVFKKYMYLTPSKYRKKYASNSKGIV